MPVRRRVAGLLPLFRERARAIPARRMAGVPPWVRAAGWCNDVLRSVLAWLVAALVTWGRALTGIPSGERVGRCRATGTGDLPLRSSEARRGIRQIERYLAGHGSHRGA
jgi:hypothetical protein